MSLPLLPWFLAYFAGVLAADPPTLSPVPYVLGGASLAVALGLQFYQSRSRVVSISILLVLFIAGIGNVHLRTERSSPKHIWNFLQQGQPAKVEGVIVDLPEHFPDKTRYRVLLKQVNYGGGWVPVEGIAQISLYKKPSPFKWGDRVRFPRLRLRRPLNFRNPGRFDFEGFMQSRDVDVMGGTSRVKSIELIGVESLGWAIEQVLTVRERMRTLLFETLPVQQMSLIRAMVFGDKTGLSPELTDAYQATGMAHLMAVSGLHIGFVAFVSFWLGQRMLFAVFWRWRPEWAQFGYARKGAALFSLVAVLAYMVLVGPKVSSLRAGILVMAFLVAFWVNRERQFLNTLILAAFLILVYDPTAVFGLGFQLSFLAVFSMVLGLQWIVEPIGDPLGQMGEVAWYKRWAMPEVRSDRVFDKAVDIFCASFFFSIVVFFGTLPVLLFQFHQVSVVNWLLNPFLVPLASILVPGCLALLFVGLVLPGLASLLLIPLGWLAQLFVSLPMFVASFPYALVALAEPPSIWLLFYATVVIGVAYWWFRKRSAAERNPLPYFWERVAPFVLIGSAVATVFLLVFPRFPQLKSDELHVWLIDVGQGESIFIECPNGETLLLDGGGYYKGSLDVGTRVVGSFLWSRGISHLDYLGATHSDQDHIDGVESILERFDVGHFLGRDDVQGDRRFSRLQKRAKALGVPFHVMDSSRTLALGEVTLDFLHPSKAYNQSLGDAVNKRLNNNRSSVIRLTYRDFKILLTGDIGKKTERWLVDQGMDLQAQVLKSPHHGSKTSSSEVFLDAVQAQDVLISSGHANYFRHPHARVMERYKKSRMKIWNTAELGALHLVTQGDAYRIETHEYLSKFRVNR